MRAVVLTFDALLGLLMAGAVLALLAALPAHQQGTLGALSTWAALGHDALYLRHVEGLPLSDELFYALTALNISTSIGDVPPARFVMRAVAAAYPALCGCTATLCTLNKSGDAGADACLTAQEDLSTALRQAWVWRQ